MKKKISVRDAVSLAIKTHGGLKPKQLVNITGKPAAQVYTAVSKMVKDNYLNKTNTGHLVFASAPALTAMKPTISTVDSVDMDAKAAKELVESVTRGRKNTDVRALESRLAAARAEVDNLQHRLQELTIKYYDTLAVLKYLESKLTITKRN
jgi:hypothetical protein